HAAVASADDHALDRSHPGGADDLLRGRPVDLRTAAAEPGDPEHATAVCYRAAGAFHQRPGAYGILRKRNLGEIAGVVDGCDCHRAERVAGGAVDWQLAGCVRALAAADLGDCRAARGSSVADAAVDHVRAADHEYAAPWTGGGEPAGDGGRGAGGGAG